ncbi:hypothetical protein J6590_020303 [Homalodisca vitripennis]|nr:hypothetical protein J6590_020303 [Homalodisca vitripennis]
MHSVLPHSAAREAIFDLSPLRLSETDNIAFCALRHSARLVRLLCWHTLGSRTCLHNDKCRVYADNQTSTITIILRTCLHNDKCRVYADNQTSTITIILRTCLHNDKCRVYADNQTSTITIILCACCVGTHSAAGHAYTMRNAEFMDSALATATAPVSRHSATAAPGR